MTEPNFKIKQGDLLPTLDLTLQQLNADGTLSAIDLTNASAALFRMWRVDARSGGTYKVNAAATFVDKPTGAVRYSWAGTDTDTVGLFYAEIVLTWSGPKPQTIPTDGYLIIQIGDAGLPG